MGQGARLFLLRSFQLEEKLLEARGVSNLQRMGWLSLFREKRFSIFLSLSVVLHAGLFLSFVSHHYEVVALPGNILRIDVMMPQGQAAGRVPPQLLRKQKVFSPARVATKAASPEEKQTPAPGQAVASSPAATSGTRGETNPLSSYVREILSLLNQNKIYPQEAIDREEEGRVTLKVTLAADGKLKQVQVVEGAVFEVLNRAAVKTVQKVAPFPSPPGGSGGDFVFLAPLVYKVRRY